MDIKQLRYFIQICKNNSFSKAAKSLFITQQGLSKAIKNLEEELQLPLFYRSANGIKLTEYGEYLYEHSKSLIKDFDLILDNLSEKSKLNNKKVSVGFSHGIINCLSAYLISNFKEAYPDIELIISEHEDLSNEQSVLNEEIDVALTIGPIDENMFNSISIKKENLCLLVNEKNPLSKKPSVDFTDLKNEKLSTINSKFRTYHNFVNKCRSAGFEPNIVYPVSEIMTVHNLARLNTCVGLSAYFVINDISSPNVYSIPFKDSSFLWEIFLITKKDRFLSQSAKTFIKYVLNYSHSTSL